MGRNRWAAVALLAGVGLRLYFVFALPHVMGDSLVYGDLAKNMLRHHAFGLTEGAEIRSTLIRLPGYPLFVAACFALFGLEHYGAVMLVQLVMDLASCMLVGALARRLAGERAGRAAFVLAALCPFTANYVAAPLTETPAVFCGALALYALERWRRALRDAGAAGVWAVCVGGALAFAVLLRPDRSLLAVAVVLGMVGVGWQNRRWTPKQGVAGVLLACAVVAAPLGAWGVRNWREFHVVQPLAPKSATDPGEFVSYGFERWYRTWAIDFQSTMDVYWTYDGSQLKMSDLPPRAVDSAAQRERTAEVLRQYNVEAAATRAVDAKFAELGAERVREHPVRYYAVLPVMRLANMWLRPRVEMIPCALDWWRVGEHPVSSVGSMLYAALNALYLGCAAVGFWRWRRRGNREQAPVVWGAVGYVLLRCALLLTMDNSEPRYTIDCFPVVFLFAGMAFARFREQRA